MTIVRRIEVKQFLERRRSRKKIKVFLRLQRLCKRNNEENQVLLLWRQAITDNEVDDEDKIIVDFDNPLLRGIREKIAKDFSTGKYASDGDVTSSGVEMSAMNTSKERR